MIYPLKTRDPQLLRQFKSPIFINRQLNLVTETQYSMLYIISLERRHKKL